MTYRNKKGETFWTSLTFKSASKGEKSLNKLQGEYYYITQYYCVLMPEIHRPQWNGIIDLVPTVIQCGSQNPHDEVQMVRENEWLRGVPFGHVRQSLHL